MIRGFFGCLLSILLLLAVIPSFAQKKVKKTNKPARDTATVYHDIYRGLLPEGQDTVLTLLQLDHKLHHDEGTFVMDESYKKPGGRQPSIKTPGFWTVLKGMADDDDATVIEVDGPAYISFYLRKNDSTLQKIDATLHEIEPTNAYIMKRVIAKPVSINPVEVALDKSMAKLAGTYKGKLQCADCSSISSTLTLQYRGFSKTGTYLLSDKYIGTRTGDIVNEKRGKWSYQQKQVQADRKSTILVLDGERRGQEMWFFVKNDGNIIQLDKNQKQISAPFDQTLFRQ